MKSFIQSFSSHHRWGAAVLFAAFVFLAPFFAPPAFASTDISAIAGQHWAWNDIIGWIDFNPGGNGTVTVTPTQLEGYASSTVGPVSLNCDASNPSGSGLCTYAYKVGNDGAGTLSGWAWNDQIGWISFFWGNATADPTAPVTALCSSYESLSYAPTCGVTIVNGLFHGWAWNDQIGWIDFNCSNYETPSLCGTSNFNVATTWIPVAATGTVDSQIFDTGVANGAQLNSVIWKGNQPSGTSVAFQFAVSNSTSGPWTYVGPDGTTATFFGGSGYGSGTPIPLGNYALAGRYFRYRITLTTNTSQTLSPRVDDVTVNWSP